MVRADRRGAGATWAPMKKTFPLLCVVGLQLLAGCASPPPTESPPTEEGPVPTVTGRGGVGPLLPADVPHRFANSFDHVNYEAEPFATPAPPGDAGTPGDAGGPGPASAGCTIDELEPLPAAQVPTYLHDHDYACIQFLWSFGPGVDARYDNATMQAVAADLEANATAYDGTNALDLRELVFFLRVGYYHGFYHANEVRFDDATNQSVLAALEAFGAQPGIHAATPVAAQILNEWVNAVDAAWMGAYFLDHLKTNLLLFHSEPSRWTAYDQQSVAYSVLFLGYRQGRWNPDFAQALDEEWVERLEALAADAAVAQQALAIVNNAIWTVGPVLCVRPFNAASQAMQTRALDALNATVEVHPYLSAPHLWAVYTADVYFETVGEFSTCGLSCPVVAPYLGACRAALKPIVEAHALPALYPFDDGALVVRTPMTHAAVVPLFFGIQEVEAQFHRISQTILPLDADPNGILRVHLYGSRSDYETYHTFLTDLSVTNGGIYIEQTGTFYTYNRTAAESIYSLDELMRHEYTHYLVGRHLIAGFWGETPMYANHRMVWFDEGLAEFLTWGTPHDGVKVRAKLVQQIANDGAARMTIAQVLSSSYGDFAFYRYAGTFFNFLLAEDPATLRALLAAAHRSDTVAFDLLVDDLKANASLNAAYQAFLDLQIASLPELTDPTTDAPGPGDPGGSDIAALQALVRSTRLGYLADCAVAVTSGSPRVSCRGYLTGFPTASPDVGAAWSIFEAGLNEILVDLEDAQPNNFAWGVCRFGAIRWLDSGSSAYPITDYFCEAPLADATYAPPAKLARVTGDVHATRLGANADCFAVGASAVNCTVTLTTRAFAAATPDATLLADLADGFDELRNQVYAAGPSLYRDLACLHTGPVQFATTDQGERYAARPVECTIP